MKKFRFSLETVLDYKQQVLAALQTEHGAILAQVRDQEKLLEELEAGFGKSVGHLPGQKDSWFTAEVDPSGIIGAAHLATREKGEELTALVCRSVVEQLNAMEA